MQPAHPPNISTDLTKATEALPNLCQKAYAKYNKRSQILDPTSTIQLQAQGKMSVEEKKSYTMAIDQTIMLMNLCQLIHTMYLSEITTSGSLVVLSKDSKLNMA
eukprot:14907978-Ditylum_brightwellii.AAC.1